MRIRLALAASLATALAGCSSPAETPAPPPAPTASAPGARTYLLERVDDAAVVQLYADGFKDLPLNDKRLVYHLTQAAIAGRDIYYDQRHRANLAMRDVLEAVVRHPEGIDPDVLADITRYTSTAAGTAHCRPWNAANRRWMNSRIGSPKPANLSSSWVSQMKPQNTVMVPVSHPYQNAFLGPRPSIAYSHGTQPTRPSHHHETSGEPSTIQAAHTRPAVSYTHLTLPTSDLV